MKLGGQALHSRDLYMDGAEAEWTLYGRPSMTMSCAVPVLSLLICAVLPFPATADTSKISARLPHHILLNTSLQVVDPPVRMNILSVRWEHNGRPLVEYKDGSLKSHSPCAIMSLEQLMQGNISLVLTNLTLSDAGNYTCVVQYGGMMQTAIYALIIEPHRIRLLNLTPPPQKAGVTFVRSTKSRPSLDVRGELDVTAQLGENVTLPCLFNMDQVSEMSMLIVHWSKDGVTKYFSNKTCCNFPGHDISEENLQRGAAPLQLLDVKEKDAGVYTCFIQYETMEGSWNTTFRIHEGAHTTPVTTTIARGPPYKEGQQDESTTEDRPSSDKTPKTTGSLTTNEAFVPEASPHYRTLKYGLVSGVVAASGFVAIFLYFCFPG